MRLDYLQEKDRDIYLALVNTFGGDGLTDDQWKTFFDEYEQSDCRVIYLARVMDKTLNQEIVVGTVSFLVEQKAHRQLLNAIHIEDVTIARAFRGLGLGKQMMKLAIEEAKTYNGYKIILECSDSNGNDTFYEKCGFRKAEIQMRLDIE